MQGNKLKLEKITIIKKGMGDKMRSVQTRFSCQTWRNLDTTGAAGGTAFPHLRARSL